MFLNYTLRLSNFNILQNFNSYVKAYVIFVLRLLVILFVCKHFFLSVMEFPW